MPCHAELMGLKDGETIAVFSSSLSAAADYAALDTLLWRIAAAGLVVGLLVIAGIWRLLGGVVTRPLSRMTEIMRRLAEGDTKVAVPAEDRGDEIGAMAKAILVFRDAAIENARLESEAKRHQAEAERARAAAAAAELTAIADERALVNASIGVALAKLAGKDLSYRMTSEIPPAYRDLQANFNGAIAELETAMRNVSSAAIAINTDTSEIAVVADRISARAEQEAANLEETNAALGEITNVTRQSAEGAANAREMGVVADQDSQKSLTVVREAVAAMDAISKTSAEIGQIIGVIDEIALPDEPAGAQRGRRGRARQRSGQRLRRGGHGGQDAGAARRRGGQGNQDPHLQLRRRGRARRGARPRDRRSARAHDRQGRGNQPHRQ